MGIRGCVQVCMCACICMGVSESAWVCTGVCDCEGIFKISSGEHATLDYGSALWYWEFPQLKYWLNLLDFGIEKNFSFIIVD